MPGIPPALPGNALLNGSHLRPRRPFLLHRPPDPPKRPQRPFPRQVVFPHAQHPPPRLPQFPVHEPVPRPVLRNLGEPELRILLRPRRMDRTPVPVPRSEATTRPVGAAKPEQHPSTNTATRSFGKRKSGLPETATLRLHPRIPAAFINPINRSSVSKFPAPRIRPITADRFALLKTSVTA
jgi:hypothetical protein